MRKSAVRRGMTGRATGQVAAPGDKYVPIPAVNRVLSGRDPVLLVCQIGPRFGQGDGFDGPRTSLLA